MNSGDVLPPTADLQGRTYTEGCKAAFSCTFYHRKCSHGAIYPGGRKPSPTPNRHGIYMNANGSHIVYGFNTIGNSFNSLPRLCIDRLPVISLRRVQSCVCRRIPHQNTAIHIHPLSGLHTLHSISNLEFVRWTVRSRRNFLFNSMDAMKRAKGGLIHNHRFVYMYGIYVYQPALLDPKPYPILTHLYKAMTRASKKQRKKTFPSN